jgi:hypothetical protein
MITGTVSVDPPSPVRLLIVLDGQTPLSGSFGAEEGGDGYSWFGLTHVVSALEASTNNPPIQVTKAHRQTDPKAPSTEVLNEFQFTMSLSETYDVIWLMGVAPWNYAEFGAPPGVPNYKNDQKIENADQGTPVLTAAELVAISSFMDQGGGVFAVGDHGSLGSCLSWTVPRAQRMRRWFLTEDPSQTAPPPAAMYLGSGQTSTLVPRISTVQPNPILAFEDAVAVAKTFPPNTPVPAGDQISEIPFENQSDDVPAPITPKIYTEFYQRRVGNFWQASIEHVPHPLMDLGQLGVLNVMPDHMHEGMIATNGAAEFAVLTLPDGTLEFPKDVTGLQPLPETIATGKSLAEEIWLAYFDTTLGFAGDPTPGANETYGVSAAYDGQPLGLGRVAVDSTWHHFFDINLIGDQDIVAEESVASSFANDPRSKGFNASAQGQVYLSMFDQYYVNLATWLAKPVVTFSAFPFGLWVILNDGHLREALVGDFSSPLNRKSLGALALRHLHRGGLTRTAFIDHLLSSLDYVILPPWFSGDPGGRPVLGAETARHMLAHVIGAGLTHLHASGGAIRAARGGEPLKAAYEAARLDGLQAWRAELAGTLRGRDLADALRSALPETKAAAFAFRS